MRVLVSSASYDPPATQSAVRCPASRQTLPVTVANQVTLARIFLIPVFAWLVACYANSVADGQPLEAWRWAAIITFAVAAASDGIDGFIARHFNQHSRLGRILDPIADKALLLTAIVTLSLVDWPLRFASWFPVVVISRDLITITGTFVVHHLIGRVEVRPHWTGKIATALQMAAVGWIMLLIEHPSPVFVTALAAIFTALSGIIYVTSGIRQVNASGHGRPDPPSSPG